MAIEIYQNDPEHQALYFASPHWVYVPVASDRHLVTLTGVVKLDFQGKNSADWHSDHLRLHLTFPQMCPPGKWFGIETCAPFLTISGINKGGDNHNGGWAVDDFGVDWGPYERKVCGDIVIWANIRVRGHQFSLFRIGYTLTVSGIFVNPPPIPPIE